MALFEMEDRGTKIEPEVLSNLIEYLAARLTEGGFQVVPLDQLRERIRSFQAESSKSCYDQNCQIELGRELAAQKTLATKILRIGKSCQVTAVLYDLKSAATESAATEEASCEIDALLEAIKKIAQKLCAPLARADEKADSSLAEFEALAKTVATEKAQKDRMEKAWRIVSSIAKDDQVQKKKRIAGLKQFLATFPKDGPYYAEAGNLLRDLESSALLIKTNPDGADLRVDGELIGRSPLTRELQPGRYEIVATLPGHKEARVTVNIEAEQNGEVIMTLDPLATDNLEISPETNHSPGPRKTRVVQENGSEIQTIASTATTEPEHILNLWGHATFWSGVGCMILGGTGLGLGLKYADDFEGGDLSAENKAKTWTGVMWTGFGLGTALVVTGAVLWLIDSDHPTPSDGAALLPAVDENGMTLSIGGRW